MAAASFASLGRRGVLPMVVALALVAGWGLPAAAPGRAAAPGGVLSLLVVDEASDAPLPGVRVTVLGEPAEGVTDAAGRFTVRTANAGRVVLVLRRLGYQPGSLVAELVPVDTLRLTYALSKAPQALDSVAVTTNATSVSSMLAGFDTRRARIGGARFLTREEIDRRHASRTTDLFMRVLGVHVQEFDNVAHIVSTRGNRMVVRRGDLQLLPCVLRVVVDGVLMENRYPLNQLSPEDIHGIEIYPGAATIPSEFAALKEEANCGLILVWTRRDR